MLSSKHSTEVNRFSFRLLSTWLDVEQYGTHLIVVSSPIQLQIGEHPHFSNFSRNGSWSPKRGIPLPHKCQQSKPTCWGQACPQAGLKEVPHGCQVSMWGEFSCLQTTRSVFQRGEGEIKPLQRLFLICICFDFSISKALRPLRPPLGAGEGTRLSGVHIC